MMQKYTCLALALIYVLSGCNKSDISKLNLPTSIPVNKLNNECIPPITTFAYPANQKHSIPNSNKIPPSTPWQIEASLPDLPDGTRSSEWVSIARTKQGYHEVWIRRTLESVVEDSEGLASIQWLIYRTDTTDWRIITERIGDLYLANDGVIWTYYFSFYNEDKGQFEYPKGIETVPDGVRLLDEDGVFWILVSHDGIYSFDTANRETRRHISIPYLDTTSHPLQSLSSLSPDGRIYILSFMDDGCVELMRFDTKTDLLTRHINYIDMLGGDTAYHVFVDHSNRVWLGDLGWMETDGTWLRIVRSPVFITNRAESRFNYTWTRPSILLESSNGLLWFQSENGMTWLDPQMGEWCWFTTELSTIVEDQDHNLWMVADGKLYRYPLEP